MFACTHEHPRSVQRVLNAEIYFKRFPLSISHYMHVHVRRFGSKRVRPTLLQRVSPYLRAFICFSMNRGPPLPPPTMSHRGLVFFGTNQSAGMEGRFIILERGGWRQEQGR